MIVKCSCKQCGGHIEFESEHAGTWVECPHCEVQTPLKLPAPVLIERTWEETQQQRRRDYPPEIFKKNKGAPWRVGFFLLLLFCALVFVVGSNFVEDAEKSTGTTKKLSRLPPVRSMHSDTELLVFNTSTNDLTGIRAYINGTPPYGYECDIGPIKAGESKVVRLFDFAKSSGERFSPAAYKVTEIWIGGGEYDYGCVKN